MRFKIFIPFFFFLASAAALFSQSSESLLIDFAVVKTQYPGETPQRCIAAVKDNRVIMRDLYADGSAGPLMYYDLGAGLHYECRQEKRRDLALKTAFPLPLPLTLHEDTLKVIAGYACHRAFAHIGADSLEIWYSPAAGPAFCPIADVPGFALEFEFPDPVLGRTRVQARALEKAPVDESLFDISGFKVVERSEYEAELALEKARLEKSEDPVAPDFSIATLDGDTFHLADHRGKTIVLNFWFIGCTPCEQEIPELNTLVREFRKKDDVVFLAVGYDNAEKVRDFTARKRFAYTHAPNGRRVAGLYNVEGFPTNVIIAPNGRISSYRSGYFSRNNENMLREAIYSARKITSD
ncbi:MAG TPA: TlpA disulfide reductase family protein [Flavilitoribacter sp.]|nr:TlpA disulfide reductase family protein [Flavilitoribacter sp.]HMQ86074.1 TlpA disulfide reductase family protein [Flavilitoribacter sp.]